MLSIIMKDLIAAIIYAVICVLSSFVAVEVRKANIPAWCTIFTSSAGMAVWSYVTKNSNLPLVKLSALYDVVGALAYFFGFVLYGEQISPIQWVGISLLILAIYMINSR